MSASRRRRRLRRSGGEERREGEALVGRHRTIPLRWLHVRHKLKEKRKNVDSARVIESRLEEEEHQKTVESCRRREGHIEDGERNRETEMHTDVHIRTRQAEC